MDPNIIFSTLSCSAPGQWDDKDGTLSFLHDLIRDAAEVDGVAVCAAPSMRCHHDEIDPFVICYREDRAGRAGTGNVRADANAFFAKRLGDVAQVLFDLGLKIL